MKNFVKTALAVLVGVAIGVFMMTLIRPQSVKAQGSTVYITTVRVHGEAQVTVKGSEIVGFFCLGEPCYIASK